MIRAVHAEWTKLRTTPGTVWLLLAIVVATVGMGAWLGCDLATCDAAKTSLTGVQLAQAVVAILAVTMFGGEYATGMMRVTLAAMPRRLELFAAKAVVLSGVVLVAATIAVAATMLTVGPPLDESSNTRAAIGSVLYLVLIGLLSLGVAAVVRQSATAIGVVLGVLYVLPVVALSVPSEVWQKRLEKVGPMSAGLAVQATKGIADLPIAPWKGLAVLAIWAAGCAVTGALVLRRRDA